MIEASVFGSCSNDILNAFSEHKGFIIRNVLHASVMDNYPPSRVKDAGNLPAETVASEKCIVLSDINGYGFEVACEAIKKSKHLFICDILGTTPEKIGYLTKLQKEAGVNIHFSRTGRLMPGIMAAKRVIRNPVLTELSGTIQLSDHKNQIPEIRELLFKMTDAVLTLIPSCHRKIYVKSFSTNKGVTGLVTIRMEFENGSIANLLLTTVCEDEPVKARIYTTGQCCSTDTSKSHITVSKILYNETGRSMKNITVPVTESKYLLKEEIKGYHSSITCKSGYTGNAEYVQRWVTLTHEILEKTGHSNQTFIN